VRPAYTETWRARRCAPDGAHRERDTHGQKAKAMKVSTAHHVIADGEWDCSIQGSILQHCTHECLRTAWTRSSSRERTACAFSKPSLSCSSTGTGTSMTTSLCDSFRSALRRARGGSEAKREPAQGAALGANARDALADERELRLRLPMDAASLVQRSQRWCVCETLFFVLTRNSQQTPLWTCDAPALRAGTALAATPPAPRGLCLHTQRVFARGGHPPG
jgi:hypothetical protein